ncbi:Integral inner nuclear membrane protein ima1 like [Verticillium longisporum]|nr:Integral inner nuclear membrane protein ima1 like [Verticillium longisporum]
MVLRTPSAIASLRSRGNLTCFYCGKRSSVKFNGIISDFLCLKCDATNYLDENGEITDPPVASTTSTTQPTQYAIPRSQSPEPAAQAPSIFCSTCLKNQHLFTASLAQYLPEDPDHPEYAQLEKNYYKFRQRLEERYPQICADCEPKVLAQVQQAGYTARTDHLRRMMERSRQRRASPKRWTALDMADTLGRWFWFAGLTGQLLWHFATMADALSTMTTGPLRDTDELSPAWTSVLRWMANALPQSSVLVRMSFWANLLCIWWNPKFTQVFRGFSKHIHGLSQCLHALLAIVVVVLYALAQNPFWYKVPPAPTTPAERLRKASNPILRSKPVGPEAVFFPTNSQPLNTGARLSDSNKSKRKVSFAQPSFFASPKSNPSDPRSTLADMLGSSFNLSQDGDSDQDNANRESPDIELKMIRPLRNPAARDRFIDIFTLGSLIASWLHVTSASYTYTWDVMLGSMALSVAVALHLTSDAFYGLRIGQIPRQLAMANSILGVAEVAAACILSFQVWVTPRGDEHEAFGVQGLVVMSLMLCHGLVNMAV